MLAKKYLIRFNEEWEERLEGERKKYVVSGHGNDGDFEVYPYGLAEKRTQDHYEPYGNTAVGAYYHYRSDSEAGSVENQTAAMTGMKTAYDGKYAPMLVPWSLTEPEEAEKKEEMKGYGDRLFLNRRYDVRLRIEKLDAETGEPILHEDGVFAIYRARRNEAEDGDGSVLRLVSNS